MFWRKKQTAAPVGAGMTMATEVKAATKTEGPLQEKEGKPKIEKLPGPMQISGFVGKYLIAECKMEPDLVPILKAVVRRSQEAVKRFDCRIFDESAAEASEVQIKDYTSLDKHPELVLYEGWFDEGVKRVQLEEKEKVNYKVPLFTETEIQRQIEALQEPGSTVTFYQARGPAVGGPLGRGAAIVELNPGRAGKKEKKYIVYTANVIGVEPVAKRQRLMESDKPKEIAKWIKDAHHRRMY